MIKKYSIITIFLLCFCFNIQLCNAKNYTCIKPRSETKDSTCEYEKKNGFEFQYIVGAHSETDDTYETKVKLKLNFNDRVLDKEFSTNIVNGIGNDDTTKTEGNTTYYSYAKFNQLEYKKNVCPSPLTFCVGQMVKVEKQGLLTNFLANSGEFIFNPVEHIKHISQNGFKQENNWFEDAINKLGASEVRTEYYIGTGDKNKYYEVGTIPNYVETEYDIDKYHPEGFGDGKWKKKEDLVANKKDKIPIIGDIGNALGGFVQNIGNWTFVSSSWAAYDVKCTSFNTTSDQKMSASCQYLSNALAHLENCLKTYDGTMSKVDENGNDIGSKLGCGKNAGGYNYKDKASCQADIGTEIYNYDYRIRNNCKDILASYTYENKGQGECIDRCINIDNEIARLYKNNHYYYSNQVKCSLTSNIINFANNILNILKYIAPILVIILGILDFLKALVAQDNDAMKKAQEKFIKRLIAAVLIFLIPIIVDYVLNVFNLLDPHCGATDLFK